MPWFNVDDKMFSHEKPRKAGLEAIGLWAVCGSFCSNNLTDGFVPEWYVKSWSRGARLAQNLVDARLWEPADGGWQFLSWPEYQRTKAEIEADRAQARERMKKTRARKK